MGKYTTKTTDDEGNDAWLASDGRQFATRSGAWKHSKSLDDTPEPPAEPQYEAVQDDGLRRRYGGSH